MCQLEIGQLIITCLHSKTGKKLGQEVKRGRGAGKKTTQLINSSHTIRSYSITSLCYWTTAVYGAHRAQGWPPSLTPLTFVFCHSLGNLKNVLNCLYPANSNVASTSGIC